MASPTLILHPVQVEGTAAVKRALELLATDALPALAAAVYQEGEGVMTDAKLLTPVDTGNLRASGHVSLPTVHVSEATVTLGFGGPAGSGNHGGQSNAESVGYAVYVHENMEAHHPVGQAKFLEGALKARTSGMAGRIGLSLQRWIRSHGVAG